MVAQPYRAVSSLLAGFDYPDIAVLDWIAAERRRLGSGLLLRATASMSQRLEGIADTGGICLSEDAYSQVRDRIKEAFVDLGEKELKNIARSGSPAHCPRSGRSRPRCVA